MRFLLYRREILFDPASLQDAISFAKGMGWAVLCVGRGYLLVDADPWVIRSLADSLPGWHIRSEPYLPAPEGGRTFRPLQARLRKAPDRWHTTL